MLDLGQSLGTKDHFPGKVGRLLFGEMGIVTTFTRRNMTVL
jgi:hypothetical protein